MNKDGEFYELLESVIMLGKLVSALSFDVTLEGTPVSLGKFFA